MNRRQFLGGLAAPFIVQAANIYVPPRRLIPLPAFDTTPVSITMRSDGIWQMAYIYPDEWDRLHYNESPRADVYLELG